MEVAAGLEPAKTGFADQRLGLFGIATSNFVPIMYTQNGYVNPREKTGLKFEPSTRTLPT
jgi:hypothetical protein